MTPDETDKTENSNEDGTEVVNLPRWDPVHVELSTDHVGSDFFDEVVEDVEEGYIVIDLDGHPPYLLMIHEGIICEIGKLHTDGGRRNIGKGFRETSMSNVSRRMRENDGTVSVYRLPAEVCVNVCRIINSEPDYGDLNTNIVDMSDMFDRLSDDGYTGTIAFTNEKNYAYMEFRGGEPTDFWYKGEEEIETVDEFVESDVDDVEVNVFHRDDIESLSGTPAEERSQGDIDASITHPDYDEIAGALADSVSSIAGSAKFYESLSKRLDVVEGADVNDGTLVVTNPEKEQVFAALCSAVQEKAKMVPASKILAEAEDRLRDAEGGEDFLRYAEDEM